MNKTITKAERAYANTRAQIMDLKRGERLVYHTGHLSEATYVPMMPDGEAKEKARKKAEVPTAIRNAAWDAYQAGLCTLHLKQVGTEEKPACDYIAVRR